MCAAAVVAVCCAPKSARVAIVGTGENSQIGPLEEILAASEGITPTVVDLQGGEADLSSYDLVWVNRPDTADFSEAELETLLPLKDYVAAGGKLVLADDAVRLLNIWGIEPTPLQKFVYEAIDDGFGRKVGFHGFRAHPIFDGLYGGAYVWHGHQDNVCHTWSFPQGVMPQAEGTRVIGTFWEYIFYHPYEKAIWETPYGEGSILSIGGLLKYGEPNFNSAILERFTTNCVKYLAGTLKSGEVERYWDYSPRGLVEDTYDYKAAVPSSRPWDIADDPHSVVWDATGQEVDIAGRRNMVVSHEEDGGIFEIWTHPFLSVRDLKVSVRVAGSEEPILLKQTGARIELRTNSFIRTYTFGDLTVNEIITVSYDRPVTVAHYQWSGAELEAVLAEFTCNQRYMWPYEEDALGSVYYGWAEGLNAFVASTADREFMSIIGANAPGRLLAAGNEVNPKLLQVVAKTEYDVSGTNSLDLVLAAGSEGEKAALADYAAAAKNPQKVFSESAKHHSDYLAKHVSINTPDEVMNEAYRWAVTGSEMFKVDIPGIGTGLLAGYSSSRRGWGGGQRVSGRPGYAWFFGRDCEWASLAFLDLGDPEIVRDVLEMMMRFQRVDGKIYHELTTSGSVHYDSCDGTPFFVVLMGRYLKATGDLAFVRKNIGAVRKAMDFIASTDTNGDRLPENKNVGHGWLEGGDFYGSITEFVLATLWERALDEASYICDRLGDAEGSAIYRDLQIEMKDIIDNDFWNGQKDYYNYGKWEDGSFTDNLLALVGSGILFGGTDADKSQRTMAKFNSKYFTKDWGISSGADTVSLSYHGAYTEENIWPLFTGTTSLAKYRTGFYAQAYHDLATNALCFQSQSHGRVPEVLSGYTYRSNGITRHQCWSETMAIQPLIDGMLGFVPDALGGNVAFSPRLPIDWDFLDVCGLTSGKAKIDMSMTREGGVYTYKLSSTRPVTLCLTPSYGPVGRVEKITVDGREVDFDYVADAQYTTVTTTLKLSGSATVQVTVDGEAGVLPHYCMPEANDVCHQCVILSQKAVDGNLVVELEGVKGSSDSFQVYTPAGIRDVPVLFGQDGEDYARTTVTIEI